MSESIECTAGRWDLTHVWNWYNSLGTIRGVNYVPSYAVNTIDWWQGLSFNESIIEKELSFAAKVNFTDIRCNLNVLVWEKERASFLSRLDTFLEISQKNHLRVMLCLFDDCNFSGDTEQTFGQQKEPIPGVHNSRWVSSPVHAKITEYSYWIVMERYVKEVIGHFSKDHRVLCWDVYNEPGNHGVERKSIPLVKEAFRWAREVNPIQPITAGPWRCLVKADSELLIHLSDFTSFHSYDTYSRISQWIEKLKEYKRPIMCTETIRRQPGKSFQDVLPLFSKERIGWFSWGLVAGRQQAYLPWESTGFNIHDPWHWDLLFADGMPYNQEEIDLIKSFHFRRELDGEIQTGKP